MSFIKNVKTVSTIIYLLQLTVAELNKTEVIKIIRTIHFVQKRRTQGQQYLEENELIKTSYLNSTMKYYEN